MNAFTPGVTVTLSVSDTTGSQAFTGRGSQVVLQNDGDNTCFIKCGASTIEATTSDFPVLSGQSCQITRAEGDTHIAAICATGLTTTLYATPGYGD